VPPFQRILALTRLLVLGLILTGCSLPPLTGRSESQALAPGPAQDTLLGRALAPLQARHPGLSGIHALSDARNAFAARVLLARAAQRSLDVQYYIWRADTTGHLLLDELRRAADRGVRVRLLLDDGGTAGMDTELAALDQHPLIEVRLFNPFVQRTPKFLGYLTDFSRTQRRMHNKSFTADSQASIVGGRNIGDEYFDATDGVLFADLDVVATGSVVPAIAQSFDQYWNSISAYPADRLLPQLPDYAVERAYRQLATEVARPEARSYADAVARSAFTRDLLEGRLPLRWVPTTLVSDDPAKVLGEAPRDGLLITQLAPAIGQPRQRLDLVSPYFVPTQAGVRALADLSGQGVAVRVLTNSLEATDVAVVHAGYAKYRRPLIEQGVQLYELRRQPPQQDAPEPGHGPRSPAAASGLGSGSRPGSSGSSLHAKTFAVDGQRLFVGSFNFDPRSAHLNTEMGLLIDSPEMAQRMSATLDASLPTAAYQVRLDSSGRLSWTHEAGHPPAPVTTTTEPGSHALKRLLLRVLGWLPIEGLL
jgi:putative cardiolipin synthase